jgi:serine-type D-Ala-D-Ala carboxypeptidase (penicillin-binding protein 5/6)
LPKRAAAERPEGPPLVSARAWAIVEGARGRLLWGANEGQALPMASTAKIMTAWLALRLAATNPRLLEESIVVSAEAAGTRGSSAHVRAGDRCSLRDLLYGVLLPSGNDAAAVLAEHLGRRYEAKSRGAAAVRAFVSEMNHQAQALDLAQTRFVDPHGLGDDRTSARDLAALAWHALQNSLFRAYVGTRRHRCQITDAAGTPRTVVWNSTNKLLGIEGYDGIKTGTTAAAGHCLVASGRHDGDHLIVIVLGCTSDDSRYIDCRNLFRWAWRQRRPRG